MTRILMVSTDYLPQIGGIAGHVHYLACALQSAGHDVRILNPVATVGGDASRQTSDSAVPVLRVPAGGRVLGQRLAMRGLAILKGLKQLTETGFLPDIIHHHDYLASAPTLRFVNKPWVFTNHSSTFLDDYECWTRRALARALCSGFDALIAPSRELAEKSQGVWPRVAPEFIPNGVDPRQFSPEGSNLRGDLGIGADEFVVLCPRRLVEKNGVEYLAQALAEIPRQGREGMRLLLVGTQAASNTSGDCISKVLGTLRGAGWASSVHTLGNVPTAAMPAVYRTADVCVIPSLREAVSLAALESLACARPVIATRVGGLPDVVIPGRTGELVTPRDSSGIRASLLRMATYKGYRFALGRNGRELVSSQYAWGAVAIRTMRVYERVLAHRGRAVPRLRRRWIDIVPGLATTSATSVDVVRPR